MPASDRPQKIRFDAFEVDLATKELRKHGIRIKLAEQPYQALLLLLERSGELVTREELQKRLWQDGVFVDFERGLNKAINRLRVVLNDDADEPRFIETLPQRGYRFCGSIAAEAPLESAPPPVGRRGLLAGVAAAGVAGVGGLAVWRWSVQRKISSIAVLPLENQTGDPGQDYFSDGMTDELTGELARSSSLRVISRTSAMRYKGSTKKPLREIARELGVDAIVEGSVAQSAGRVRIAVQLIDTQDDRLLWSERYERDRADVLALQNEVAKAIARQVHRQATAETKSPRRVVPEAHEMYLRAYAALYQGPLGVPRSLELFRRTVELDAEDANGYAGFAEALCYAGIFGFQPTEETYPQARKMALRALELDEGNAPARNVLADVKKGYDWDMAGAEGEYRRALVLNPSHLLTRLWFGEMWSRLGRHEEAIAESRRAGLLDPVSPFGPNNLALICWRAGRFDEAIAAAQRALALAPGMVNALWWLGLARVGKGEVRAGLEELRRAEALSPSSMTLGYLGYVLAVAGKREEAQGVLRRLQAMANGRYVAPADFAAVHAGLGEKNEALRWMELALRQRNHGVHTLRTPIFDLLRGDGRYVRLLRESGLG